MGTMLLVMLLAQFGLVTWKKFSPSSFDRATLVALWLFPVLYACWHGISHYWRLMLLWACFSSLCGYVMRRALTKPIARSTPRLVYHTFFLIYRVSYATAVGGYLLLMAHFTGLMHLLPRVLVPAPSSALITLFYGLYFGVLGRDLANVVSGALAVSLGYAPRSGELGPRKSLPSNVCAICDQELIPSFRPTPEGHTAPIPEKIEALQCGHQFHDWCLRGWTMIGKRDTCAACNEKVQVKERTKRQPWMQPQSAWALLLDALRYLLVYNPVVLISAQLVLYIIY